MWCGFFLIARVVLSFTIFGSRVELTSFPQFMVQSTNSHALDICRAWNFLLQFTVTHWFRDLKLFPTVLIVVSWVITSCSLVGGYWRFRGTWCLYLRSRNKPWRRWQHFPPKPSAPRITNSTLPFVHRTTEKIGYWEENSYHGSLT
jgi:hypothetical protein